MNPRKTVVSVLYKGVGLGVLVGCLGTSSVAAPVPLPDWVKPIESSLPRLSPEVISEVDEIRTFMLRNAESLRYPPSIKAQWETHNLRFVELRKQADQAMIWQYLKATISDRSNWSGTLSYLGGDRDLAAWLLPVVRFRIEWLKQALPDPEQHKYIERVFDSDEMLETEAYLFLQGEFSDIKNLNLLVDEGLKLKFKIPLRGAYAMSGQERLQAQVKAMQEARNLYPQTRPTWQMSAVNLITEGVITEDALKLRPSAQNPGVVSNAPKPLGPRKPLPEISPPSDYPEPWMVWQIWLFLFVVSAVLLRWVFRKPKRPFEFKGSPP